MRLEDLILVSVDDHVVEPPDVFEHHLPAKYKDIAPRVEHRDDGTDAWKFLDFHIPNVGLNAVTGRPPEEYGMDPTSFDELRKGTYDVRERVLDMSAKRAFGCQQPGRMSSNVTPSRPISSGANPAAAMSRFTEYLWSS